MSTSQQKPAEQLNDLIDRGAMTPDAVAAITGLDQERIDALPGQPLSHRGN